MRGDLYGRAALVKISHESIVDAATLTDAVHSVWNQVWLHCVRGDRRGRAALVKISHDSIVDAATLTDALHPFGDQR